LPETTPGNVTAKKPWLSVATVEKDPRGLDAPTTPALQLDTRYVLKLMELLGKLRPTRYVCPPETAIARASVGAG
jgi:hypothetical protein